MSRVESPRAPIAETERPTAATLTNRRDLARVIRWALLLLVGNVLLFWWSVRG